MARYKHIDTHPRFLAVNLQRQLLPGTFEHALNHLLDRKIDLSGFEARFCNDLTGAAAYPPAMLLADFEHQAVKLEAAVKTMLARHREQDERAVEPDLHAKEVQRIERLQTDAAQLRHWSSSKPKHTAPAASRNCWFRW